MWKQLIGVVVAIVLVGCVPTRYAWSPDGSWMTVLSDDGLRISDAEGNLLPGVVEDVTRAAWFADSKRLAISRTIKIPKWQEFSKYLSGDDEKRVEKFSDAVSRFIQAYDWRGAKANNWDALRQAWMNQLPVSDRAEIDRHAELAAAVLLRMRDGAGEALRKAIPSERWREISGAEAEVQSIEVRAVTAGGLQPGKQIMTTLKGVRDMRVSPVTEAVLVSLDAGTPHDTDLYIAPADGSRAPMLVSDRASWYADWAADGRTLVFIQANAPAIKDEQRMGALCWRQVVDENGGLTDGSLINEIAGVLFSELERVRAEKSGRIYFTALDVTLPVVHEEVPQRPIIFAVDSMAGGKLTRLLGAKTLAAVGGDPTYFEVSPDEQYLSIPEEKGRVFVVNVASDTVIAAQGKEVMSSEGKAQLLSVPQWRSADELTFVAPDENDQASVQLWSVSGKSAKVMSSKWPAGAVAKKPLSQDGQEPGGL